MNILRRLRWHQVYNDARIVTKALGCIIGSYTIIYRGDSFSINLQSSTGEIVIISMVGIVFQTRNIAGKQKLLVFERGNWRKILRQLARTI